MGGGGLGEGEIYFEEVGVPGLVEVDVGVGGIFGLGGDCSVSEGGGREMGISGGWGKKELAWDLPLWIATC